MPSPDDVDRYVRQEAERQAPAFARLARNIAARAAERQAASGNSRPTAVQGPTRWAWLVLDGDGMRIEPVDSHGFLERTSKRIAEEAPAAMEPERDTEIVRTAAAVKDEGADQHECVALVACTKCGAAVGAPCVRLPAPAALDRLCATKEGDPLRTPHQQRRQQGLEESNARRRRERAASPEGMAEARREEARREEERDQRRERERRERREEDARRASAQERRDAKRANGGYNWSEDDDRGKKRQRLVQWLMMRPRCVPLEKAKLIACRKYP